jgi:hypothetical protein
MARTLEHNFPSLPPKTIPAVPFFSKSGGAVSNKVAGAGRSPKANSAKVNSGTDPHFSTSPGFAIAPTPTFGENLPGLLIEAIADPDQPGQLILCSFDSKRTENKRVIFHEGRSYLAPPRFTGLARIVRFAPGCALPSSGPEIVATMNEFLLKYADLDQQTIDILIAFVFATWFVDCFVIAPVLCLNGPTREVSNVMRLLSCVCYHGALLSDLNLSCLGTLPTRLPVTLLLNQAHRDRRVQKSLLASTRRGFYLATGKEPLDLFGARALSSHRSQGEVGLTVSINPQGRILPTLSEAEESDVTTQFQSQLLGYRFCSHSRVRSAEIESPISHPGLQDELRTWLAATWDIPDVKESVLAAFADRQEEFSSARYEEPKCLVAEAALMFCHRGDAHFFVGELGEKVNDLLAGRHADCRFEDRKVGATLKELGIHPHRVTKGFRVDLDDAARKQIHQVAAAYRVLSAKPDTVRCAFCPSKTRAKDKGMNV